MLSDTVLGWWHLRGGRFGPRCLRCTRDHRDWSGFWGGRSTRAVRGGWGGGRGLGWGYRGRGGGRLAPTAAAAGARGPGPGVRDLAVGLLDSVRLRAVRRSRGRSRDGGRSRG